MAAYYTFEDLSGAINNGLKTDNPYHDLINDCQNDEKLIQQRYNTHRVNRNAQQKQKLLAPDFEQVTIDEILMKLENTREYPGYQDPRHCLVFWARPTQAVQDLIGMVQKKLKEVVPNLWIMPRDALHMTALEITHSLTAPEIDALVEQIRPHAQHITDYTTEHRPRLVKPIINFDAQALALSWLPAAGESGAKQGDYYTYHHLRKDLFTLVSKTGVKVASRYVTPSAHLTIGRFITQKDFQKGDGSFNSDRMAELVSTIDEINESLQKSEAEWVVGEERGLDFRKGPLWYGVGGETVTSGKGF